MNPRLYPAASLVAMIAGFTIGVAVTETERHQCLKPYHAFVECVAAHQIFGGHDHNRAAELCGNNIPDDSSHPCMAIYRPDADRSWLQRVIGRILVATGVAS